MSRPPLQSILAAIQPPRGRAWHGGATPGGALKLVTAREAHRVPAGGRNSIWALALHIAYWKYAVRRRLEPGPGPRFPRSPANWPRVPARAEPAAWRADRALLEQEHRALIRTIAAFPASRLGRRPPGGKWTYGDLIVGILAHDAYHTGQIQLLKRAARRRRDA